MNFLTLLSNMPSNSEYLRAILRAPVKEISKTTSLQKMKKTSVRFCNTILVKREDEQLVHSFKIRGAYSMINNLNNKKKLKGIITASAGNHAQGVALSADKLGIKSLIIMPVNTADIKINAVKEFNGKVFLFGANFDESQEKAIKLSKAYEYTFIPPFDHPEIIAGQGTLAMELLQQDAHIDRIFVPVGGGGLVAGIAVLIKKLMPQIKVIAVEAENSACLSAALKAGKPVTLPHVSLFAEGVAVKRVGNETFRLCNMYLDDIISVDNDAICAAMKDLFEDVRAIAEPSGALALAGVKKYIQKYAIKNERLVHILSGANINFHNLRYVSERCDLGEKKEALLAVIIPEKKGSFLNFCRLLRGYTITEFNYRYFESKKARIFIGVYLHGIKERLKVIKLLSNNDYKVIDLSEDEMAKLHVRYMIGGRLLKPLKERLYSFIFPESTGSLLQFLMTIGDDWHITLFHYRSHGTDYGRVLAGFQLDKNKIMFLKNIRALGYECSDETENLAFNFFLSY